MTQRDKWIKDCRKKLDIMGKDIEQYECYLNDIPKSENGKYVGTLKTFNVAAPVTAEPHAEAQRHLLRKAQ